MAALIYFAPSYLNPIIAFGSLPELGRMADKLKLVPDAPQRS
jgi:hypothetical protein